MQTTPMKFTLEIMLKGAVMGLCVFLMMWFFCLLGAIIGG